MGLFQKMMDGILFHKKTAWETTTAAWNDETSIRIEVDILAMS